MKQQTKPVKLKNRYSNEYVYCNDLNDTVGSSDYTFYKVYNESNPNRTYLANKDSFIIEKD